MYYGLNLIVRLFTVECFWRITMEPVLSSIIGALVAGAVASAGKVGGKAVSDAYEGLKELIIGKLKKRGTVISVEEDPHSEVAQEALAEAIAKGGVAADPDLASSAKKLEELLSALPKSDKAADIDVGNIRGKVNAVVDRLTATGRIKIGDLTAETGDARLTNLTAGIAPKKD
jgi:hypothetical protein